MMMRIGREVLRRIDKIRAQIVWSEFEKHCIMGKDCHLGPNAWCVNPGSPQAITLGDRVFCRGLLRCGTRGNGRIVIGDEVYVGDDSIINAEEIVSIGSLTMIAHGVQIHDSTGHPTDPYLRELDWRIAMGEMKPPRPAVETSPVKIGKRVWIGFNSVIMRGVTIGDNATVAAGSVVVRDVPSNSIVAGNPAQLVKTFTVEEAQDTKPNK
jgi:acetyltransferase-like isoleucine patch superfamily enzyme